MRNTVGILAAAVCALVITQRAPRAWAHPPPFYWMPDLSTDSHAGADMLVSTYTKEDGSHLVFEGGAFFKASVSPHVSILARVPFAYVDRDSDGLLDPGVSAWALGNVSMGVLLAGTSRQGRGARLRYGLGIEGYAPTASDSGEAGLAAGWAGAANVPDPGRFLLDTATVRVRGDLRYERHAVFVQGDVGVDHRLVDDADDRTDLFAGLGAGLAVSHYWAFLAELTLMSDVLDDVEDDDDLSPVLDLGLRYHNPGSIFGLHAYWPIDHSDLGHIGVGMDVAVRF